METEANKLNDKKVEKLKMFSNSPELAMFDMLDEINEKLASFAEVFKDLDLSEVDSIKGDSPKKGVDYFTEDEIEELKDMISEDIMPVKGVHYFDGEKGEDGKSIDKEEIMHEIKEYIDEKLGKK
ncbi:hypothetical protein E6Q11_03335 [Candidatus Dojkabacteria bacterium]|uniref:Uncharacterized protein n=1 Tax=Candidatus Dojkabacteria bacterium TaxID=2099670 RepID=A0A5C7J727_9BACT|nr:MAG: hypothetical protein E6Q11_03335 [Candidatus Dojkabacteria bacterium]